MLADDVLADDPEFADAVGDILGDVVVADEHEVDGEVLALVEETVFRRSKSRPHFMKSATDFSARRPDFWIAMRRRFDSRTVHSPLVLRERRQVPAVAVGQGPRYAGHRRRADAGLLVESPGTPPLRPGASRRATGRPWPGAPRGCTGRRRSACARLGPRVTPGFAGDPGGARSSSSRPYPSSRAAASARAHALACYHNSRIGQEA